MQKRDLIQANASLENLRQNLDMKDFTKEITALGDSLASIRAQMKALSESLT